MVDEDAAIVARIEREDLAEEEAWKANRKGDLHGEGVFARIRKEKQATREREAVATKRREKDEAAGLIAQAEDSPKGLMKWTKTTLNEIQKREETLGG